MKQSLRIVAFTVCVLLANPNGWAQVSYLGLDGGLEGSATIDNATAQTVPAAGVWRKANATQTIAKETGTVRSGANSLKVNNSSGTGRRVWSPNFTVSSTTSQVTVQYYIRVADKTNSQEAQPGIINNTEGLSGAYSTGSANNTWTKVTYSKASSTWTTISGLFLHRALGTGGDMFMDDMCVYTGAVDNTAPNSPTATVSVVQNGVTPTTKLDVSWGAASGGVDGGGYLVVRYLTTAPVAADDPNTNGIYAVGNTITVTNTGIVAYVGTGTSFTDAGLTPGATYYYKIYTYDKAYNYSAEFANTGTSGTTATSGFAITVTQTANGTISPGTTNVASGANQTFTITPAACYSIASLTVDGSPVAVAGSYTFTNVTATHTITATYSANGPSNITASAGPNGTVTPSGATSVACGGSQTYTITPNACYSVTDVLVDGVSVGAVTSYTFTNVTAPRTISATFGSSASYNIVASAGANGSISPTGTTSVPCGNNQTYTITPNACYDVLSVTVDGVSQGAITSYTFSNVTATHTIAAAFVLKTFGITASAGANGTVTPTGTTNVNCGSNQTYTITPNSCFSVLDVLVDGVSVGAVSSYTFTNVTAAHTISATFVANGTSNIVASAGPNGSISPAGTTAVACGASQGYTITANSGYAVSAVTVDGVGQGAINTYTFTNVTAPHTISATFAAVTITTSPLIPNFICPGGTVSVPYTISSAIPSTTFSAQLSDAGGVFANTTSNIIGTLTSTTSGTITGTIPSSTANGTGYRIRVLTSTIVGSDNTQNIVIQYSTASALSGFVTETMGSAAGGIAALETANGFDNDPLTMSTNPTGTVADVRTSTASTVAEYATASGGANVFIPTTAGVYFQINGINTLGVSPVLLSFGLFKSTTTDNGGSLGLSVSSDGTTFSTPVPLALLPTGTGTSKYYLVKVAGAIPSSATAAIRFVQLLTGSATFYRIDDINIYYGTPTVPSITPSSPPAQCGGTITLTANPNLSDLASVTWSNAATTSSIAAGSTGNYSATITDGFGCVSNKGPVSVNITIPLVPSVSIVNSSAVVCSGVNNTFTATAVNGGTPFYQWKVNGGNVGSNSPIYTATANSLGNGDVVTVDMTSSLSCVSTSTVSSNPLTAQKLAYSPTTLFIENFGTSNSSVGSYISATNPTLAFSVGGTPLPDIRTSTVSPGGGANVFMGATGFATRYFTVSNINTSSAYPNKLSFYFFNPDVTAITSSSFWLESSTDGTNFFPINYGSIPGGVGWSLVTINNALPKFSTVWLRFNSNLQGSVNIRIDDIKVEKYTTGDASITPNGTISLCSPATQTLNALPNPGSGLTYAWSNSTSGTSINVISTSTSSVTLTDVFGCQSSASQLVTINTTPTAAIAGTTTGCGNVSLTASGGTGYAWSGGSTPATAANSFTTSNTYTVTVTAANTCTASASAVVTVNTCTNTWIGNTTQWSLGTNWTSGTAPTTCAHDAVIPTTPAGGNFPLIGTGTFTVGNLTIQDGATITVNAPLGGLNVCGNLTGGVTTDAVVTGTGELRMVGSVNQTISGKITLNTLRILTSTTAVMVNVTGNVSLNKALVMDKGKVANSGTVTLKSNAATTAYLDNFTSATAGTYTGNLTVERYLTNKNDGYRNISSPVTTKVSDLNDDFPVFGQNGVNCWYSYNPYPNVQYYNESLNNPNNTYPVGYVSYTSLTNNLVAMKGLAARIYPNNTNLTLDFTGKPNTGNKSFPITFTNTGTIAADGWNLVGNCYPSPILWGKVKLANPGEIDAAYYVFQTTGEYTGNWGSFNGTTSVNGATNEIGIGQGFWVLASGNTTLDMNQGVRTAKETTQFFKTDELQNDEIRLSIGNGTQMDEIVTYTDPNGTKGYDRDYDAVKMPGSTVSMSFTNESNEYAINVIDAITAQTELPLNITTEEEGVYSINATELNTELPVYLKDQVSNTLSDLKAGSVSIYLNKGEVYNNRYSVVFDAPQVSGIDATELNPIRIFSYNNRIVVERPTNTTATINVSNVLGQQVMNISTTTERTELPMTANEPWYAFVKVTEGNKVSVAKVLIKNK